MNMFDVKSILMKRRILGDLPSNREIYQTAFKYAWPSTVESVLVSLVGMVDTVMVSGIGQAAIAATGITAQPKFVILAPILALNIAITVIIARRHGENRRDDANRLLANAILISISFALIFSLLGFIFAPEILRFAGADQEYLGLAVTYFKVIMVGNFFNSISLSLTSAQRGAGNTKISMCTNISANLVNIFFNYLLINGIWIFPKWGVFGAAFATMLGDMVSFTIAVISISKKGSFVHLRLRDLKLKTEIIKNIFDVSKSSLVEQIFFRLGMFTYVKMIAGLGTTNYAAHVVFMTILQITFQYGNGISIAASALVGRNLGAHRSDIAFVYSKIFQRVAMFSGIFLSILTWLFQVPLLSFITHGDQDIIAIGQHVMPLISIVISMQIMQVVTIGSLRGAGDLKFVALITMVSVALIRPILTYAFAYQLSYGILGAWMGYFLDQLFRSITSNRRFHNGSWMEITV